MLTIIDQAQYAGAASLLARANTTAADLAMALFDAVGAAAESAGKGDGTRTWCTAYEQTAADVTGELSHLIEALGTCASLIDASADNHGHAEQAAAPYGLPAYALPDVQRHLATASITGIPTMYGGDSEEPWGWGFLSSHLLSHWWPGADLPRVRALGRAWHTAAERLRDTAAMPVRATAELETMASLELADATSVCQRLAQACTTLAADCDALGTACTTFAADVERQRDQVNHLVKEFCGVAGITELVALGASLLSGGISELVAKAVDSGVMAAYATRITAVLDTLSEILQSSSVAIAVSDASKGLSTWLPAVADARPILAAIDDGTSELATGLGIGLPTSVGSDGNQTETDDEVIDDGWADRKTLARHFAKHHLDVSASSEADYVAAARLLLRRARQERLPMKVSDDGTVRVFDPDSGLFGSYRSDGRARTIFRPTRPEQYWERQPGALQ